jgi:phosphate-selective porin OprO/OprP
LRKLSDNNQEQNMKISKLTLAIATVLGASASASAVAMDLYVDTKTKQIYAEPGRGRELMGSFEKVEKAPAKLADKEEKLDKAEIAAIREDLATKDNAIKALQEHAAEASAPDSVHVKLTDGIHFATKDGNFTAGINGRLQVDSQTNVTNRVATATGANPNNQLADGMSLRRARLGIEGTFFKDTDYKFEYDFTRGNGTTGAGVTDAFIRYNFSKPFSVKFGAFKEPFSLEEATSNRYITFIQRNQAVDTFVDDLNTYKMGIGANYAAERWQVATSLQTEPVGANGASNSATGTNGNGNRNGSSGDTNWEWNGRVSGMPWMESKTKFLHVGTSGSYINVNNNYLADGSALRSGGISFAHGLNNNVDRTSISNTGNLTSGNSTTGNQANHLTRFGAESALVYGPFSAQGEYIATNVTGRGYDNETLDGYYGYVTYFLTGESRAYKSKTGAWDRLKPNRNFDMKGGWGAWELAAGYDALDLNTLNIKGGRTSTAKFGVNWYPNSHVRVMANWVHALDINTGQVADARSRSFNNADLDVIETRVQLDW